MRTLKIEVKVGCEQNFTLLTISDESKIYVLNSERFESKVCDENDDEIEDCPNITIISDDQKFKSIVEKREFDLLNMVNDDSSILYNIGPWIEIKDFVRDNTNNLSSVTFFIHEFSRLIITLDEDILLDYDGRME